MVLTELHGVFKEVCFDGKGTAWDLDNWCRMAHIACNLRESVRLGETSAEGCYTDLLSIDSCAHQHYAQIFAPL